VNNLEKTRRYLKGPILAMTTPIKENDEVDYDGLAKLTNFYIKNGIKVLLVVGSTGYCYTLTEQEHKKAIETVVQTSAGRVFTIAGVSHSGTMISNRLADICEKAGANALLMTPPYYHQTSSTEGVYEHYKSVAKNHTLGLIVYKTGSAANLDINFFQRIADIENIIGIKDASVDYEFGREICVKLGDRFVIISGGSMRYYLWHWLWGAPAYISSIANLVPKIELEFYNCLEKGDLESAKNIVIKYEEPYLELMGKYGYHQSLHLALKMFGLPAGKLRLPLVEPPKSHIEKMRQLFVHLGLLK